MASRRAMLVTIAAAFAAAGCTKQPTAGSSARGQGYANAVAVEEIYASASRVAPGQVRGELLDGTAFDLESLAGSVVLINFWASWCPPCRAEIKDLIAVVQATKDLPVAAVGVNVRDDRDRARAFAQDFAVNYPSLFDPPGQVALSFADVSPTVLPATVILDRHGKVAAVFRRTITSDDLEPVLHALAAEPGTAG